MDLYSNEEHMKTVSQSDLRAQLEVISNYMNDNCLVKYKN